MSRRICSCHFGLCTLHGWSIFFSFHLIQLLHGTFYLTALTPQVGGITQEHANTDIEDAINVGFDAFALNLMSLEDWSTEAVSSLFNATEGTNFKLFFSFDMTHFTDPSQFLPILEQYVGHDNYYLYDSKPFVSTFDGGTLTFGASDPNSGWQSSFKDALSSAGVDVFFVPDFDDASNFPTGFFDTFSVVDGAFSWESAWPYEDAGKGNVSDTVDNSTLVQAHAAEKIYMMREWSRSPSCRYFSVSQTAL